MSDAPADHAQEPLWRPTEEHAAATQITAFAQAVNDDWDEEFTSYDELWRWSTTYIDRFWLSLRDFCDVRASNWGDRVLDPIDRLPGVRWFPEARLNFAENLLRRDDDTDAIVFWGEDKVRRRISWSQLRRDVARLAAAMRADGLQAGDRVAAFMPNVPETIAIMLAAASIGATFTSCSPDFGVKGVLDRFGQVGPTLLFAADGYFYKGRHVDTLGKLREILAALPTVRRAVLVPYAGDASTAPTLHHGCTLASYTADHADAPLEFAQLPFDHPLYIMYSSGTTGAPKCIVHGAGGTLLQHLKEHQLHCDIKPGDRVFYFTTCGWMMWNWLATALASEATILLYDGNPFHPSPTVLFDYADAEGMTLFGTSAKFIDALNKAGATPAQTHDLSTVRVMTSTGSPLVPESYDYVYANIKADMQLASISGGTDIIGCFVLGNPIGPVWRGEIQCRALGMAIDVFDEDGTPIESGKGELVCTGPFPSMPIGFWNDPDDARYSAAYFDHFPGVWRHGDWIEVTARGGVVIYGRSDATLNPGGVRIGTAEIYRQVERLDAVLEAIVVGQEWQDDVRVVLFVRLREGITMTDTLRALIRSEIRRHCTARHVPAVIEQVADIPRTKSGKITELAVRKIIHGEEVRNREALANPEALDLYRGLAALRV